MQTAPSFGYSVAHRGAPVVGSSCRNNTLERYAKNLNHLTLPEIKDFGRVR